VGPTSPALERGQLNVNNLSQTQQATVPSTTTATTTTAAVASTSTSTSTSTQQTLSPSQPLNGQAATAAAAAVSTKTGLESSDVDQQSQQSLASGVTPKKKPFSSSTAVNNKLLFGTMYEVKCDETFAYYDGYVYDFDEKEQKLKVAYSWKDDQLVPVNYVRPLTAPIPSDWKPKPGDHAECQAKAEESEPYGWWECIIKTVRDNLYLINYEGWENHQEVLQHAMLRPYNNQEPFEDIDIVRDSIELTEDQIQDFKSAADLSNQKSLTSFMNNASNSMMFGDEDDDGDNPTARSDMQQLRRIAEQTGLIHLNFNPVQEALVLIGNREAVRDARMLITYLWSLRNYYREQEKKAKEEEGRRQDEYDALSQCEQVRFEFHASLTKYVIGTKGANIEKAKDIDGVRHIWVRKVDDATSECLILATDKEAAHEARCILEMEQTFELIPKDPNLKKELIGKDGENIRQLEERSNVIKISTLRNLQQLRMRQQAQQPQRARMGGGGMDFNQSFIDDRECEDPNFQKLIIIGPKSSVDIAKNFIQMEVSTIQQKSEFLDRKRSAQQERNYGGGGGERGPGGGGGGTVEDMYYEQQQQPYGGGNAYGADANGQQSMRRKRRREQQQQYQQQEQQQQQTTEQSNMDTSHYNYANQPQRDIRSRGGRGGRGGGGGNMNDREFPSLGAGGTGDAQNQSSTLWTDIDAQDMVEEDDEHHDHQQQQQQQQQHETGNARYGGGGGRSRGGRRGRSQRYQEENYEAYPQYDEYQQPQQQQQQQQPAQAQEQQHEEAGAADEEAGAGGGNGGKRGRGGAKKTPKVKEVWKVRDKSQPQEANASPNQ